MSTPTLKFNFDCLKDMQLPPRLPFWDTSDLTKQNGSNPQDHSIDSNDSFMNSNQKTAFQIPATVKKNNSHSVSKKSNFLDPTQFLLSLKKDKSRSQLGSPRNTSLNSSAKNLSNLASKWKASSEPFFPPPLSKKNQSIVKLQTTNEALLNLSTSPSGRFESIHNIENMNIPRITLTNQDGMNVENINIPKIIFPNQMETEESSNLDEKTPETMIVSVFFCIQTFPFDLDFVFSCLPEPQQISRWRID